MNDLVKKLASRKFWSLIIGLVIAIGILYGVDQGTVERVIAVIGAFSSIMYYMYVEGNIDISNKP